MSFVIDSKVTSQQEHRNVVDMEPDKEKSPPLGTCLASIFNHPNDPTGNEGSGSTFSRANVFGIFLALSFCLLTQPHGSVLYMRPSRIPGRIIFFFWRLNPLACAVEAVMLLYVLLGSTFNRRSRLPHGSPDPLSFKQRLQLTAAAILFVRKYTRLPEQWAVLADKRQWESVRSGAETHRPLMVEVERDTRPLHPVVEQSADIVDEQRLGYEREAPMREAPPPPYSQTRGASRHAAAPPAPRPTRPAPTSSSVQSDNSLESGHSLRPEAEVLAAINSFRAGRTGHVFKSAEHFVHFVSTVSVIIVIVKIAATDIPTYIHVATWLMISGWATLEMLLTAAGSQQEEEETTDISDKADMLRHAFALQSRLHCGFVWRSIYLLCLPVLMYLSYVAFFKTDALAICTEWRGFTRSMTINLYLTTVFWYNIMRDVILKLKTWDPPTLNLGACVVPTCREVRPPRLPACLIGIGIAMLLAIILAFGYGYQRLEQILVECADNPSGRAACGILLTSNTSLWFSAWFFIPIVFFSDSTASRQGTRQQTANNVQVMSLLWNLLVTASFFVASMLLYDSRSTYKPDWLDWLGKMNKWTRDGGAIDMMTAA